MGWEKLEMSGWLCADVQSLSGGLMKECRLDPECILKTLKAFKWECTNGM